MHPRCCCPASPAELTWRRTVKEGPIQRFNDSSRCESPAAKQRSLRSPLAARQAGVKHVLTTA